MITELHVHLRTPTWDSQSSIFALPMLLPPHMPNRLSRWANSHSRPVRLHGRLMVADLNGDKLELLRHAAYVHDQSKLDISIMPLCKSSILNAQPLQVLTTTIRPIIDLLNPIRSVEITTIPLLHRLDQPVLIHY